MILFENLKRQYLPIKDFIKIAKQLEKKIEPLKSDENGHAQGYDQIYVRDVPVDTDMTYTIFKNKMAVQLNEVQLKRAKLNAKIVEKRRRCLEKTLNHIASHSVFKYAPIFQEFLQNGLINFSSDDYHRSVDEMCIQRMRFGSSILVKKHGVVETDVVIIIFQFFFSIFQLLIN
jgi:hypothetical protein